jgi:hypothetical protein
VVSKHEMSQRSSGNLRRFRRRRYHSGSHRRHHRRRFGVCSIAARTSVPRQTWQFVGFEELGGGGPLKIFGGGYVASRDDGSGF